MDADGSSLRRLTNHAAVDADPAWSPDGALLADGGHPGRIRLWDVASGKMLICLRHGDEVTSVAFSPDGALLASGAYDSKVFLWGIPR